MTKKLKKGGFQDLFFIDSVFDATDIIELSDDVKTCIHEDERIMKQQIQQYYHDGVRRPNASKSFRSFLKQSNMMKDSAVTVILKMFHYSTKQLRTTDTSTTPMDKLTVDINEAFAKFQRDNDKKAYMDSVVAAHSQHVKRHH